MKKCIFITLALFSAAMYSCSSDKGEKPAASNFVKVLKFIDNQGKQACVEGSEWVDIKEISIPMDSISANPSKYGGYPIVIKKGDNYSLMIDGDTWIHSSKKILLPSPRHWAFFVGDSLLYPSIEDIYKGYFSPWQEGQDQGLGREIINILIQKKCLKSNGSVYPAMSTYEKIYYSKNLDLDPSTLFALGKKLISEKDERWVELAPIWAENEESKKYLKNQLMTEPLPKHYGYYIQTDTTNFWKTVMGKEIWVIGLKE